MEQECNARGISRPDIICLEYHPNDSRIRIADDDICQSLTQRMGTGGVTYLWYLKYMNVITLTEKRFFEWHEDEVSVTLRNKSGSYGGVVKYSSLNVIGMIADHPTPKINFGGVLRLR